MKTVDKQRVEKATVTMLKKGGQGVLVPGNYFITATHVVEVIYTGMAALDYPHVEPAKAGQEDLVMQVCAAEAFSDIAVLEEPSDTNFIEWAEVYNVFRKKTSPVPVCLTALKRKVNYKLQTRWDSMTAWR
jgi:hypothetical protein